MKKGRAALIIILAAIFAIGPAVYWSDSEARSRSGSGSVSRSSGSFGKSSPWTGSTQGTWDRRGGGLFGPNSSSGYSKPSLGKPSSEGYSRPKLEAPSSSGYSKPTFGGESSKYSKPSVGESQSSPSPERSSSGYTKPSYGRTGSEADSSPGRGQVSSGYSKPSLDSDNRFSTPSTKQPSSSGYSKPWFGSGTGSTGSETGRTSGGYAKPTAPSAGQRFEGGSAFDKDGIKQERKKRSQESLQRYQSEQAKFKNPTPALPSGQNYQSNPIYDKSKVYSGFDYNTYYSNRDNYYRSQNYQAPSWAYNSSPSFGIFNSLFLFWMLDHMSDKKAAAFAYNHQNDPGFQKWRDEVEKQAQSNTELKSKLAEMDKQIKSMEGTPKDPSYLPKGVPPEVALAPEVLATKKPERPVLRLATGQIGGWYDKYGKLLKKDAKDVDVQIINTNGSMANLKLLADGEADMAIVQSDVLAFMDPGKKVISEQTTLYSEYAQLIANRKSGIKSIKDIDPKKNVVYIGPKGSGTALTWENLGEQAAWYKKIPVRYGDYAAGLAEVKKNPNALMFFVGGLNNDFLKLAEEEAAKSGNLRLVTVDDRHFDDKLDKNGNSIYSVVSIASDVYPYLQKGWFFSGNVETLGVRAVLVLRTDWATKYGPQAMDALSVGVMQTKPEIQKLANKAD